MILGLTEPAELDRLQLSDLAARVSASGLQWCNAPIADFAAPDARFERNWPALRAEMMSLLDAGRRILVHCRAGKGRSGTVAAALLVGGGMMPDEAIQAVRRARPGAIETAGQENWVRALAASGR